MEPSDYLQLNQLGGGGITLPESPDDAQLETVRNPHSDSPYLIRFTCPEFTSLCPVTGQPDFAHMISTQANYVESKSLKLYLGSFAISQDFMRIVQ